MSENQRHWSDEETKCLVLQMKYRVNGKRMQTLFQHHQLFLIATFIQTLMRNSCHEQEWFLTFCRQVTTILKTATGGGGCWTEVMYQRPGMMASWCDGKRRRERVWMQSKSQMEGCVLGCKNPDDDTHSSTHSFLSFEAKTFLTFLLCYFVTLLLSLLLSACSEASNYQSCNTRHFYTRCSFIHSKIFIVTIPL